MTSHRPTLPTLSKHSTRELKTMHERVTERIERDERFHRQRGRELEDLRMFETMITEELNRREQT